MKTYIILFYLFVLISIEVFAQNYDPKARKEAIVIEGNARFTVLTDRLIRMEYQENGHFTDQASLVFVNRNLPVPDFSVEKSDTNWLVIETLYMTLRYKKNSGKFSCNNLIIQFADDDRNFEWRYGLKDKDNLKGTTRTLDGVSGKFLLKKLRRLKLDDGILSRSGWSVIDDSERPLFDNSEWSWVESRISSGQDLYFFGYGNNYKAALFDYTQVAGKIPVPPKFAFGVWYSKWWNYTDEEYKGIVREYRQNDVPLDILVLDMDWHLTEKSSPEIFEKYGKGMDGWTGFTWEKKYFPDYRRFLAWTDSNHIQTCLNLHPAKGVQPYESQYADFAKAIDFDTIGHKSISFNITDKRFAENYFKLLLHPYEEAGVDFWWLDWQQSSKTAIKGVNPTYYLNYLHFSDMQRQQKRPIVFHRWGGLGNHRYPIGFSGDTFINWRSLKFQPEFTATASNVGFGYWSHDIGGFFGFIRPRLKKNPELFTRWVQLGALSPIFRTHSSKDKGIERRIWMYEEPFQSAMKKAVHQRYALIPYIYTFARKAYDTGICLIRPLYYENPSSIEAYKHPTVYYFGENILVAPITKPKSDKQKIWLPPGEWYNFYTFQKHSGKQTLTTNFKFDQIPMYVKAGTILPEQTKKLNLSSTILDTLLLTIFPDNNGFASFELYEDDGKSLDYQKEVCLRTLILYQKTTTSAILKINPKGQLFEGLPAKRTFIVQIFHTDKPSEIKDDQGLVIENINYNVSSQILTFDFQENINKEKTIFIKL